MLPPDLVQQVFAPLLQSVPRGDTAQDFYVLYANGRARWLLPAHQRNLDSVLAGWSPYRWDSRLKWRAVRAASRIECLSLLPGIATSAVGGLDSVDWKSVGWNSDVPPVTAVYLGTPGASRKAVIHLVDSSSGICQIILKVPINDGARAAILREAEVLSILAMERCTFAPRLLSVDPQRDISAQTVLPGAAGSRRLLPEYLQLLRALRLPGATTSIVEHAANLHEQLLCSVRSDRTLETTTTALSELQDANPLPTFWVHGDFAPWNIKQQPGSPPTLLDWEDARRGGLPLQDVFHFLHIQDYLFGKRPTSHAGDLKHFSGELGLSDAQCRQLEIAYLLHSYLRRLDQAQTSHSDFLLDTLEVVLRGRGYATAPLAIRRTRPNPSDAATSPAALQMRSNLFSAVIAEFDRAQLPYCILGGYEEYPERIPSDVDFMVHPADMARARTLLAQAAEAGGGRVIQAIQHETSACYFVLAKDAGATVGFLNPDCCSDYRRQGRLWLRADAVLEARTPFKSFYVPSVPDEFIYYLIKKVLKQSIDANQMRRLHGLYQRAPYGCGNRLHRFWSSRTVDDLKGALVDQDLSWFVSNSEFLLSELEVSRPVEHPLARLVSSVRKLAVSFGRILRPTGMCVIVEAEDETEAWNIGAALRQSVAPAFRWTRLLPVASKRTRASWTARYLEILKSSWLGLNIRLARIRSTLVICILDRDQLSADKHRLTFIFTAPDVAARHGSASTGSNPSGNPCPEARPPMDDSDQHASRLILEWLSTRQLKHSRSNKSSEPRRASRSAMHGGRLDGPHPALGLRLRTRSRIRARLGLGLGHRISTGRPPGLGAYARGQSQSH